MMSTIRRISSGTVANIVNLAYATIIVAATVPVLTHAWGVDRYGTWIMLTAIPTYLALSDFGFSTAATNDIAMSFARGETDSSAEVFQSVLILNILVGAAFIFTTTSIILFINTVFPTLAFPATQKATIIILTAYAALCMVSRVFLGAFRATGLYTQGTLIYDSVQFAEGAASLLVAFLGGGFLAAASALLLGRALLIAGLSLAQARAIPWLPIGFKRASLASLKRLTVPAFGSLAIPVSLALNMQGVALVVGAVISPSATATLGAVRTASRLAVQVISAVNRAMVPELSAASARGDHKAKAKMLRFNSIMLLGIVVPAAIGFALIGSTFITWWSGGRIHASFGLVAVMALAMALHSVWFFGTNLLSATNSHGSMAPALLLASISAVGLAWILAKPFGLLGAAAAVALAEAACVAFYLRLVKKSASHPGTRAKSERFESNWDSR